MLLCVANWSEGRDEVTLADIRWAMRSSEVKIHYEGSDPDHNRIVTAFSGWPDDVDRALFKIADAALDRMDMRKHEGVHPRIGALDVCPFIIVGDSPTVEEAKAWIAWVAERFAKKYDVPVLLYEKSETGKHAADLPSLRKGQYEGLFGRNLDPDFGPRTANPWYGATVMGLRDWLLAVNVNLATEDVAIARQIARELRRVRDADPGFAGVRALGLPLPSRGLSQVSMSLTRPDETSFDPIAEWIERRAGELGTSLAGTELIGVIRRKDLERASRLNARPEQVVC